MSFCLIINYAFQLYSKWMLNNTYSLSAIYVLQFWWMIKKRKMQLLNYQRQYHSSWTFNFSIWGQRSMNPSGTSQILCETAGLLYPLMLPMLRHCTYILKYPIKGKNPCKWIGLVDQDVHTRKISSTQRKVLIKKTVGPKKGVDQEEQVEPKRDSNEKIQDDPKKGGLTEISRT